MDRDLRLVWLFCGNPRPGEVAVRAGGVGGVDLQARPVPRPTRVRGARLSDAGLLQSSPDAWAEATKTRYSPWRNWAPATLPVR
jgi:hypothetical protein